MKGSGMSGAAGGEGQVELGGEKSDRASSWPSKYMRQLVAASGASAAAGGEAGGDGERETCGGGWRLVHASLLKKNYREIIKFDREILK